MHRARCLQIHLLPFCRCCIAGPDGRQDLKFKSCRSGTMTLAEPAKEAGQLPIRQRRMVADLANLPAGGLPLKLAPHLGGIEHLLQSFLVGLPF